MAQKNYINNRELYTYMIKYLEERKHNEEAKIPKYIGESILLICNNLFKKPNFSRYTYKEDMISDAVCDCVAAINNFDPDRTNNPFAYFTQIAWNAYVRRIFKEKRQTYIKHKNYENLYVVEDLWQSTQEMPITNEFSSEIIKSYEDHLTKNKLSASVKKRMRSK